MADLARSLDSDLTHESECRSCHAVIVWSIMDESSKRNPLDRQPDPDGRIVVESWQATDKGMAPVVRVLRAGEVDAHEGARYVSHFSSCPNAKEHRR